MEYAIGLGIALAVAAFAARMQFDGERSFGMTVLIVVATYYVLFAVMGAPGQTIVTETLVAAGFLLAGLVGLRWSPWWVAVAIAGHGAFDLVHHLIIENPGVPPWWPGFCLTFDIVFGAWLAWRLKRRTS